MPKLKNILILLALSLSLGGLPNPLSAVENINKPTSDATLSSQVNVVISTPQADSTVMNRNTEFRGTAYKNALVNITIVDTDMSSIFIEHQANGRVTGTATSDDNGDWSFVPQQELTPGRYSVSASVADVSQPSGTVNFYVTDESGASSWIARWLIYTIVGIGSSILLTVIFLTIRHWLRKRQSADDPRYVEETEYSEQPVYERPMVRHYDVVPTMQEGMSGEELLELDREAAEVEKDLASAARQIDNASQEVAELRDRIHEVEDSTEVVEVEPSRTTKKVSRRIIRRR